MGEEFCMQNILRIQNIFLPLWCQKKRQNKKRKETNEKRKRK